MDGESFSFPTRRAAVAPRWERDREIGMGMGMGSPKFHPTHVASGTYPHLVKTGETHMAYPAIEPLEDQQERVLATS